MKKKSAAGNRSNGEKETEYDQGMQRQPDPGPEPGQEQEHKERSALDTYRMWLNESSSSSSSEGSGGNEEDKVSPREPIREKAAPIRDTSTPLREHSSPLRGQSSSPQSDRPSPLPHGPSPLSDRPSSPTDRSGSQHLQPPKHGGRSHTPSPRSASKGQQQSSRLRLHHNPRRFLAQSLRTMLPSPSPSPSAPERLHPRVPRVPRRGSTTRRGSMDNGMATLYGGDAWLAQARGDDAGGGGFGEEKPAQFVRTSGGFEKPGFYEVSLEEGGEKREEAGRRRRSYRWAYRRPDGRGAWLVALGGVLALWAGWSPLVTYPIFAAYYDRANLASLGLGGDRGHALLDPARGTQGLPARWRYSHGAAVLGAMTGALHVAFVHLAFWASGQAAARRGSRSLRASALAGALLAAGGFFGAAFCRSLGAVCALQGAVAGAGCGLLAAPAWALVPVWFTRRRRLAAGVVAALGAGALPLATAGVVHVLVARHGMRAGLLLHAVLALALGPAASLLMRPRAGPAEGNAGGAAAAPPGRLPRAGLLPLACLLLSALLGGSARTMHLLGLPAHARRVHGDAAYAVYALAAGATLGSAAGAWLDGRWLAAGDAVAGLAALAVWTPAKGLAPVVVAAVGVGAGAGLWAVQVPMAAARWAGGEGAAVPRVLGLVGLATAAGALLAAPAAVAFEDKAPANSAWLPALAGVLSLGAAALALLPQLGRQQKKAGEAE
ncbi:hypothetical protein LPJ53_005969 [Coemansia erecta]|uniref:MFS general substrate transporter n=1 Tax=Coemansia erecta TaxID=147472 RepID=A0A9W8CP75_9FUNG|nr:hypothetical protein LPJ53_005969 [Coemansia erecta]